MKRPNADDLYTRLVAARSMLRLAQDYPLRDGDEQDALVHHLGLAIGIIRAAHDKEAAYERGKK